MAGGYFFWTLTEYWMHRLVFHFEPEEGIGARLHWIIHGVHHDHPNDPLRLVMPPSVSVPLALIFFGLFVAVLPDRLGERVRGRASSPATWSTTCSTTTCTITARARGSGS